MASGVYLKESAWNAPFVVWNKPKGHRPTLEKTWPDHSP